METRGVYVTAHVVPNPPGGIGTKILAQLDYLNSKGFPCELLQVPRYKWPWGGVIDRLPGGDSRLWNRLPIQGFDFLYIRRPPIVTRQFLEFLSVMKRVSRGPILYDIPTYPYDFEHRRGDMRLARDRYYRGRLKEYVDRVVDLSGADEVFGIPTIPIVNGVDMAAIRPRTPSLRSDGIHVLCAASFSWWHGIDRLIEGMVRSLDVVRRENLHVHLVGNRSRSLFESLVVESQLETHVHLYDHCGRQELDALFDRCTLAIECLGGHRKRLGRSSSLKSREYLAKGIPFIYAGHVDVFDTSPVDFCLQVPADETPIDVEALVAFHTDIYRRYAESQLISSIRAYAENRVSLDAMVGPVVAYLRERGVRAS